MLSAYTKKKTYLIIKLKSLDYGFCSKYWVTLIRYGLAHDLSQIIKKFSQAFKKA